MYCRNCRKEISNDAIACPSCGLPPLKGRNYCHVCGNETNPEAIVCVHCGANLSNLVTSTQSKSKLAAGLLGIFLGWLGIHNFYLGYTTKAVIQLLLTFFSFLTLGVTGGIAVIWGLIEGILILTGSIDRDAKGNPLKE